jgi:hypothetical protein
MTQHIRWKKFLECLVGLSNLLIWKMLLGTRTTPFFDGFLVFIILSVLFVAELVSNCINPYIYKKEHSILVCFQLLSL